MLGYYEFVALASPDDELTLAPVGDLASDGIIEESMLQAVNDETFKTIERFANLPAFGALTGWRKFSVSHYAVIPSCP